MSTPILATKLYLPPPRPRVVPRPRLVERLNEGLHGKLTLDLAPAGFGKTTLVSEWLAGSQRAAGAAWLALDEGDSDLTRFLTYLVAALQTIAPQIGEGVLAMLQSPQPPPTEALLTALLNEIAALPDDFILVLDDYHVIDATRGRPGPRLSARPPAAPAAPGHHHPRGSTAAPGSLARPGPTDRTARRRPAVYPRRSRRLSQRGDGSGARGGGSCRPGDAHRRLDCRSATGGALDAGRADVAAFVKAFAGDNRYIVDYLVEEVLQRQPERVRSFLLQTSILDRLSGPLCDAVTGQNDGMVLLDALERGNLFVVPLDDQTPLVSLPPPLCRRARCPCAARSSRRKCRSGISGRARGTRTMVCPPTRFATRWPPRISPVRRAWSSWRGRPWTGVSSPPRGWAGRRRSPTSWCAPGPCSALPMPGRC